MTNAEIESMVKRLVDEGLRKLQAEQATEVQQIRKRIDTIVINDAQARRAGTQTSTLSIDEVAKLCQATVRRGATERERQRTAEFLIKTIHSQN